MNIERWDGTLKIRSKELGLSQKFACFFLFWLREWKTLTTVVDESRWEKGQRIGRIVFV